MHKSVHVQYEYKKQGNNQNNLDGSWLYPTLADIGGNCTFSQEILISVNGIYFICK